MRITVRHVRSQFSTFVEVAQLCGFDVAGWTLRGGDREVGTPYELAVVTRRGGYSTHPVGSVIGSTSREAYDWLGASIQTMSAMSRLGRSQ